MPRLVVWKGLHAQGWRALIWIKTMDQDTGDPAMVLENNT